MAIDPCQGGHFPKSVFEKWVARATRPCRSATRRPERARLPRAFGRLHWLGMPGPFRPASRRTAQASGLCYPKRNSQTRSKQQIQQMPHECRVTIRTQTGKKLERDRLWLYQNTSVKAAKCVFAEHNAQCWNGEHHQRHCSFPRLANNWTDITSIYLVTHKMNSEHF